MLEITNKFLTVNDYSRPGRKLCEVLGIVLHWTANPAADEWQNWRYFEDRKNGRNGYGSAHYIIGQSGHVVAAIPDNEVAYHCGSSQPDPASNKIYTDEARARFGHYASETSSPNNCTIGVELCPIDSEGHFTEQTVRAAVELCAWLCERFNLRASHLTTHHNVVGWKDCPRLWTKTPALFEAFKADVANLIYQRGENGRADNRDREKRN